jgi:hypothetical protein
MLKKILMDKPTNNSQEVGLRLTKIAGIAIVFSIYLLIGFYVGVYLDKQVFKKYDEEKYKKRSKWCVFLEVCIEFSTIGVLLYISRNLVEHFLTPLIPINKIFGFNWSNLRELKSGYGFTFMALYFQNNLKKKLDLLAKII